MLVGYGWNVKLGRTLGAGDAFIPISVVFGATDDYTFGWRWSLFVLSGSCVVAQDPCSMLSI